MTFDELMTMLGDNMNYPKVQEIAPVNAQLGFKLIVTPQISSGLPTTSITLSDVLVAKVMNAEPFVKENFSYDFGMQNAFVPMPKIGRNFYNLTGTFFNSIPTYAGLYAFINLLSTANSLILCRMELQGGTALAPQRLVMRNSCIYDRPNFMGITAGATDITEIESAFSIAGSIDFSNTTIGDNLTNIMSSLGTILGATGVT